MQHSAKPHYGWVWWHAPVVPALNRLLARGFLLEASLGYILRLCVSQTKIKEQKPMQKGLGICLKGFCLPSIRQPWVQFPTPQNKYNYNHNLECSLP